MRKDRWNILPPQNMQETRRVEGKERITILPGLSIWMTEQVVVDTEKTIIANFRKYRKLEIDIIAHVLRDTAHEEEKRKEIALS